MIKNFICKLLQKPKNLNLLKEKKVEKSHQLSKREKQRKKSSMYMIIHGQSLEIKRTSVNGYLS
jgi:hypothetical protein